MSTSLSLKIVIAIVIVIVIVIASCNRYRALDKLRKYLIENADEIINGHKL
jgi:sensor domain CHASE-containing protein